MYRDKANRSENAWYGKYLFKLELADTHSLQCQFAAQGMFLGEWEPDQGTVFRAGPWSHRQP